MLVYCSVSIRGFVPEIVVFLRVLLYPLCITMCVYVPRSVCVLTLIPAPPVISDQGGGRRSVTNLASVLVVSSSRRIRFYFFVSLSLLLLLFVCGQLFFSFILVESLLCAAPVLLLSLPRLSLPRLTRLQGPLPRALACLVSL